MVIVLTVVQRDDVLININTFCPARPVTYPANSGESCVSLNYFRRLLQLLKFRVRVPINESLRFCLR